MKTVTGKHNGGSKIMNTLPGLIIILIAALGAAITMFTPRIVIKKYEE